MARASHMHCSLTQFPHLNRAMMICHRVLLGWEILRIRPLMSVSIPPPFNYHGRQSWELDSVPQSMAGAPAGGSSAGALPRVRQQFCREHSFLLSPLNINLESLWARTRNRYSS